MSGTNCVVASAWIQTHTWVGARKRGKAGHELLVQSGFADRGGFSRIALEFPLNGDQVWFNNRTGSVGSLGRFPAEQQFSPKRQFAENHQQP